MLINTFLDTEDFVHLYYPEDEPSAAAQGCGAGARMASKYPPRPPSPEYSQVAAASTGDMSERERYRVPPPADPPPHRVRAADLYPRLRTHYDEPGLEPGFMPICGEFVQWVGRLADGGTVAMSNYRLHIQAKKRPGTGSSVPLRLIDAVEIRDLMHLVILCKHGRQLKAIFASGDQCVEWWRRLNTALAPISSVQETFAAAYAAWSKEQPPLSVHRALMRASHAPHRHWFGPEVERLGFTTKGAWRVTAANADYKLCPSYPPLLVVPASIGDEDLDSVARFRAMRRIPAVVWRHRGNGAVIARSSQPEVGWLGWRSSEDERLLAAFITACYMDRGEDPPANTSTKQPKLLIVDARSYTSAVTNRARGGGCECQQYYPGADIQFMCLPNIHHVRRSFQQMRAITAEPSDQANWLGNLERTLWPQYLSGVLRAASLVARAVLSGRPALVHCSDGWDRTPQIVAAAQLMVDPYYRTREGFRVLIEREWLDFGHKFADRCGHQFGPEEPNERSPIFLQWLDVVYQLQLQYPCSFEFNEAYLIKLATHVHSCMFGTFLCNTSRERAEARVAEHTPHVWRLLDAAAYTNHLYEPAAAHPLHKQAPVLRPECSVRSIRVWAALFCEREADDEPPPPPPPPPPPKPDTHNGLMTKTRSCDNLLNEAEKRTTQRRCSDPSLAPDVMKLSMVSPSNECSSRRNGGCKGALTDSCVDELPVLPVPDPACHEQVDGLHPDHFENSTHLPRDIASGSSSLERELVGDKVIEHTDGPPTTDAGAPGADATDGHSPEDQVVFIGDAYADVNGMASAARESGRTRNISITWRSISESSNQSSGFDLPDAAKETPRTSHESSPIDNHNSTDGDLVNHNVVDLGDHSNHNGDTSGPETTVNGTMNGVDEATAKFLEVELNAQDGNGVRVFRFPDDCDSHYATLTGASTPDLWPPIRFPPRGGGTSSSVSSESEGEAGGRGARAGGRRHGSQLTLCPASPRRPLCCHCSRRQALAETSGESSEVRCEGNAWWCGALPPRGPEPDPLDGLPPAPDPLQMRLHQIITQQNKVVEELSYQLRKAREELKKASQGTPPGHQPPAPDPPQCRARSMSGSGSGSVSSSTGANSDNSSGSASEVEVGEEARGVVWLPDSAAPRCQHCRNHFWLARRRHHCRRCGGIFCGSCSEMSSWGDCGSVRVCRRCRAQR